MQCLVPNVSGVRGSAASARGAASRRAPAARRLQLAPHRAASRPPKLAARLVVAAAADVLTREQARVRLFVVAGFLRSLRPPLAGAPAAAPEPAPARQMASHVAWLRGVLYESEHEVENIVAEYDTGAASSPSAGSRA